MVRHFSSENNSFLFVQIQKVPTGGILVIIYLTVGHTHQHRSPLGQLELRGPIASQGGFIQVFLRKPLATYDVLGGGLDQVPTSGSVHCPWKYLFGCIVHGNIYLYLALCICLDKQNFECKKL